MYPSVHVWDIRERGMRDKGWAKRMGAGAGRGRTEGEEKGSNRREGQETVGGNDGK